MPSAAAPSRSLCSASRLRSRQVSCSTGSMPLLEQHGGRERAQMRARAGSIRYVHGVRQAFEWQCFIEQVLGLQETGGVTSAVITNRPDASAFSSWPLGDLEGISGFTMWTTAPFYLA